MSYEDPQPGEIDQVHAESRDDLEKLLALTPAVIEKCGPVRAAVELAGSLIYEPAWGRMELASALGVALVRLAEAQDRAGES